MIFQVIYDSLRINNCAVAIFQDRDFPSRIYLHKPWLILLLAHNVYEVWMVRNLLLFQRQPYLRHGLVLNQVKVS